MVAMNELISGLKIQIPLDKEVVIISPEISLLGSITEMNY